MRVLWCRRGLLLQTVQGLNVQKTDACAWLHMAHTNTWEANTHLHKDGGSHNHQCVATKATVGKAGSRQTHPLSSLSLPPSLPLSLLLSAVLDPSAAGDKTCALLNTQESKQPRMSHLPSCRRMNAIKLLFLCSLCARVSCAHLFSRRARMTTSARHQGTRRY